MVTFAYCKVINYNNTDVVIPAACINKLNTRGLLIRTTPLINNAIKYL